MNANVVATAASILIAAAGLAYTLSARPRVRAFCNRMYYSGGESKHEIGPKVTVVNVGRAPAVILAAGVWHPVKGVSAVRDAPPGFVSKLVSRPPSRSSSHPEQWLTCGLMERQRRAPASASCRRGTHGASGSGSRARESPRGRNGSARRRFELSYPRLRFTPAHSLANRPRVSLALVVLLHGVGGGAARGAGLRAGPPPKGRRPRGGSAGVAGRTALVTAMPGRRPLRPAPVQLRRAAGRVCPPPPGPWTARHLEGCLPDHRPWTAGPTPPCRPRRATWNRTAGVHVGSGAYGRLGRKGHHGHQQELQRRGAR